MIYFGLKLPTSRFLIRDDVGKGQMGIGFLIKYHFLLLEETEGLLLKPLEWSVRHDGVRY